ncbi:ABC transporter ATP-binding protein [Exilibacterium tricleocarpae]|uniref:ABC transporter ATP-binding protein n=1 Tax=Exilibacterium tricleocarpae TaxID=2591008 RepID=A0A545T065_9GAMM|nr:ABC transporter ATP-binding protein [Exilibacterium tricleocarpae]TQV70581.1 ABC transporter ATP-binding protein [Exilibacterium tricleocarpae]
MKDFVLVAKELCVERGGQRVLDDVSFNVGKGEVFALLGGNGAGKSTTLLTFLGFIAPSSGSVTLNGAVVHEHRATVHQQTAYLPESARLYPHLSARENLNYFLSLASVSCPDDEIEQALDAVSLAAEARSKRLSDYSKGMRQKVAIALAILRKTPVLLLDEPTSGLDPVAIDEFNAILIALAEKGTTILMVTHDVYGACHVARRVGLLQRGHMVGIFEASKNGEISAEEVHRIFVDHQRL